MSLSRTINVFTNEVTLTFFHFRHLKSSSHNTSKKKSYRRLLTLIVMMESNPLAHQGQIQLQNTQAIHIQLAQEMKTLFVINKKVVMNVLIVRKRM